MHIELLVVDAITAAHIRAAHLQTLSPPYTSMCSNVTYCTGWHCTALGNETVHWRLQKETEECMAVR